MKIIEKIKALLAKAASTDSQHEAEIFFAKAHELLEKHQLDISDLSSDDPMGEEETYHAKGRGGVDWDGRLMFAVAKYFGAEAIQNQNGKDTSYTIVGRESARVTAIEMHRYLVKAVRRLGRENADAMEVNADVAARRIGVALRSRLGMLAPKAPSAQTAAGKNALVTLDAVKLWIEQHHPDLSTIKGVSRTNGMARGIANGIGLNHQAGYAAKGLLK